MSGKWVEVTLSDDVGPCVAGGTRQERQGLEGLVIDSRSGARC